MQPRRPDLHAALDEAAAGIRAALADLDDWGLAGTRPGQYRSDIAADAVAVETLTGLGLGVLSEETGLHHPDRDIVVVVDPLDGSTNASRAIPWYATSLCAVDAEGALAALVINLARGTTYRAERGAGATVDDQPLRPSGATAIGSSLVALNGWPPSWLGWNQCRMLGAAALELCAVASGLVDAYIDCSRKMLGPWDYLGGMLVCQEVGAPVAEVQGRDLVVLEHAARRGPVAAASPALLEEALAARRRLSDERPW